MEEITKKLIEYTEEYFNEMMAQGAWCGHMYAAEYFSGLRQKITDLLNECEKKFKERKYEHMLSQVNSAQFALSTDYDALIKKVYELPWEDRQEVETIADALDSAFLSKFEEAIEHLKDINYVLSENKTHLA